MLYFPACHGILSKWFGERYVVYFKWRTGRKRIGLRSRGEEMPLSNYQESQIKEHVSQFPGIACPICYNRSWAISDELNFLPMLDVEYKMPIEGQAYPLVVLGCGRCGYVRLFSARRIGIL